MQMKAAQDIQSFVERVRAHDTEFYRDHWGTAQAFGELPPVSREDFRRVPLSKRRYKNGKAMVKVIRDANGPFLSEWAADDIREELYSVPSKRPMVYLSNAHESLEKGAWCRLNGMPSLVGEREPEVAAIEAERFRIDSLITDSTNLPKLRSYLEGRKEKLATISVLDTTFDIPTLRTFDAFAHTVRLVLALPEVGAFAESTPDAYPRFRVMPNCIVEQNGQALVTKLSDLVTPVIRYRFECAEPLECTV
ncbi:hypothetical protein HY971_01995 [Candidatus Kaiserbacteria bacterium]|nr:hypothetical protein [Candidatus Kaiserbacteria bacterium]